MDKYSDLIYKLLHKRKYRNLFLEEHYSKMNLDDQTLECVKTISKEDLTRTSQKIVSNVNSFLKKMDAPLFEKWQNLFPEDAQGTELTCLFLESKEYSEAANFAFSATDTNISQAFRMFFARVLALSFGEQK